MVLVAAILLASSAFAQDNFFQRWQARATKTQSTQPSWVPPIFSAYPMLIQVFRTDITRQVSATGVPTWNYGAGRGLNLVPGFNSEVDFYPPPYIQHNSRTVQDGFGDIAFLYKYRFLSANEKHGNYMLSAQMVASAPTSSSKNGTTDAVLTPALLAGKGFGRFDILSTLGGALPVANSDKLGRTIAWNTTAQYHLGKYLWPELGSNATWYYAGKNDGKMQNFITPGLMSSKFKFHPRDAHSRTGVSVGVGMQIATSGFHTYNHNLIFSGRLAF